MPSMVTRFYYFIGTGTIQFIGGFIMYFGWIIAGYRQAQKCRASYLTAIFRQPIGWFETQDQSKIFTQFISDCNTFEEAINEKMAIFLYILSSFLARIIVSLIVIWQLSLVLIGFILIIAALFFFTELIDRKYN
jgi:ATP-binding cassette subfamily B (MDR/TAP) protein 1